MKQFIWLFIGISFLLLIGSSIYKQIQKESTSARALRIECQKKLTAFERVYIQDSIKTAQKNIEEGNYILSSSIKKAVYAKSKLFDFVHLTDMDKVTINTLASYIKQKKTSDEKLKISYYIYENDVEDPGKKTQKSKLYAGYVVYKFSNSKDVLLYQVQIDFMDKKGIDLPKSIACAIKSFMTL
jgi:hypothetical protein